MVFICIGTAYSLQLHIEISYSLHVVHIHLGRVRASIGRAKKHLYKVEQEMSWTHSYIMVCLYITSTTKVVLYLPMIVLLDKKML